MDIIKIFSGGFPLTIERLIFLQETYKKTFSQFSKILGSGTHYIISGVNERDDDLKDGVVCINGEILPFIGGLAGSVVTVRSTSITVPYNEDADNNGNLDLKAADTLRICYANLPDTQDDDETHDLSLFVRSPQLSFLLPKIGDVKMIARAFDPVVDAGWELIDMGDRFPIGAGVSHTVNAVGGSNSKTIAKANLPAYNLTGTTNNAGSHSHSYDWEDTSGTGFPYGAEDGRSNFTTKNTSSAGNHSHTVSVASGGGGVPLDVKPSFRAFNFLIFVGI